MKFRQLNLRWTLCNNNLINNKNHSILQFNRTHPTILIENTGAVAEVEVVDEGVGVVAEAVADKEAENEVNNSNKYSEQILPNTVVHTVLAVIPVGFAKTLKKDISITPLSTWD